MPRCSPRPRHKTGSNKFDHWKPNNPNIPFFASAAEYRQTILRDPPVGSQPDRKYAWLVEPGIYSIEVYEAIILKSLGSCPPLAKYICKSGQRQAIRSRSPYVPVSPAEDRRLREERDVCFTLVSLSEQANMVRWMRDHGIESLPNPNIATPYGIVGRLLPIDVQLYQDACRDLGFGTDGSDYPRSALPPGVIPFGSVGLWKWAFPLDGIARDGRATDDCSIQRIEWPARQSA